MNFNELEKLVYAAGFAKYGNFELSECVLDFVRDLIDQPIMESQAEDYLVEETPLSLLKFDTELYEAMLHWLKDEHKLRHDKDGKAIVGMHKGTNRYKGDKKTRDRLKARAYYNREGKREEQRLRMRKRRAIEANVKKANQNQADREEAEATGRDILDIQNDRIRVKKEIRAKKRAENQSRANIRSQHTRAQNKSKSDEVNSLGVKKSDIDNMNAELLAWAKNKRKR